MDETRRRWLRIRECAVVLGVSVKTCYQMAARGELPVVRISSGRKGLRIDGHELERRLERQLKDQNGRRT